MTPDLSTKALKELINSTADVITVVDENGIIQYQTPSAERVVGYGQEELVGESVFDYIHPEDVETAIENFQKEVESDVTDEAAKYEFRFQHKDGTWIWLEPRAIPEKSAELGGFVIASRDVSERKGYEKQLKKERDRLDQFASIVSHDLQNPLSVILGHLRLLDGTPDDQDHIDAIERSAKRIEDIITDLLELSKVGQSIDETEPVSLARVAAISWNEIQSDETALELQIPESVTAEADRARLMHIFENLYSNAIEHNEPPLTIRTGTISSNTAEDDVESVIGFFIEDDGDGVPKDERDKILDHGYTTKTDGTGFGLSIVEEVIDAHGWSISICDSDDGGARFEVTDIEIGN